MALTVPLFPSVTVTSLIVMSGLQSPIGEAVLRGFGEAVKKSDALSFVSTQPPALGKSAVVLAGAGAGPEPSKQWPAVVELLPYPTRSMIEGLLGLKGVEPSSPGHAAVA